MRADEVFLEILAVLHRQSDRTLGVLDIHLRDGGEAVLARHLHVRGRTGARAVIGGVAFDDRPLHRLHKPLDEVWIKKVVSAALSRADLDRHVFALGPALQSVIDGDQARGADILRHINLRRSRLRHRADKDYKRQRNRRDAAKNFSQFFISPFRHISQMPPTS